MDPDRFRLDPRTKLLLLIGMNVVVYSFGGARYLYSGVALGAVLMLAAGAVRPVVALTATYAVLVAGDALVGSAPGVIGEAWTAISLSFVVFLPTAVYALLLLTTTTITEAAAALEKLRVPTLALVPLLVLFRFVPALAQDFRAITNAMRLRGLIGRGNPFRLIEFVYVPLLLGVVRTGDQLTIAALTRGLGLHRNRTFVTEPRFRAIDLVAIATMIALVAAARLAPVDA
ncbi:MAG: energy-coupling factor transporter transmembrane component T [Actinomycetota bacterium]